MISSVMKTAAVQLSNLCTTCAAFGRRPRCGLYEIRLPAMQLDLPSMPAQVTGC